MILIRLAAAAGITLPVTLATAHAAGHGHPGRVLTANYQSHRDKVGINLPQSDRLPVGRPIPTHRSRS